MESPAIPGTYPVSLVAGFGAKTVAAAMNVVLH
jgi:hypothetical protein